MDLTAAIAELQKMSEQANFDAVRKQTHSAMCAASAQIATIRANELSAALKALEEVAPSLLEKTQTDR